MTEKEIKQLKQILCPECGTEINFKDNDFNNCPKPDCELNAAILSREYWGRIRIAPDDQDVDIQLIASPTISFPDYTPFKKWMNPRYPDGK